jgi:hypothetical protein
VPSLRELTTIQVGIPFQEFCKLSLNNVTTLATIQKSKTITSKVEVRRAKAERSSNLVKIICIRLRNSLIIDDIRFKAMLFFFFFLA